MPPELLLADIDDERRGLMVEAGEEVLDIARVLAKSEANVVTEIQIGHDDFYEWKHYPKGDVFDPESHSQFYYHSHSGQWDEHGHFHTFLRAKGMPDDVKPVEHSTDPAWPDGDEAISHLIAISMNHHGVPTHLFTTNRWVTGETFYPAADVIEMLDRYDMDLAKPSWATNRWITAMLVLFRPQIDWLISERDRQLASHATKRTKEDASVYEDRSIEVPSMLEIDIVKQLERLGAFS